MGVCLRVDHKTMAQKLKSEFYLFIHVGLKSRQEDWRHCADDIFYILLTIFNVTLPNLSFNTAINTKDLLKMAAQSN